MQITIRIPCAENERFVEGSLDSNLGKEAQVPGYGMGKIVAVEIIEDGRSGLVTFEV